MILRHLEKILTLTRHFRSTWPMRPGFRKMLQLDILYYHTKYHRDTPWRLEDIRSRTYNELFWKNFQSSLWRHFRSDRYEFLLCVHRFKLCTCIANLKEIGRYLRKLQIWRFWCIFILHKYYRNRKLFVSHIEILKNCLVFFFPKHQFSFQSDYRLLRYSCIGNFAYYAYISGTGSAIGKFEKQFLLFTNYTSCTNLSSVALIVASESWCEKNNKNTNNNNNEEGTAESVKGQLAVAPLTLIILLHLNTCYR